MRGVRKTASPGAPQGAPSLPSLPRPGQGRGQGSSPGTCQQQALPMRAILLNLCRSSLMMLGYLQAL